MQPLKKKERELLKLLISKVQNSVSTILTFKNNVKILKQQMLEKVWRKGNPATLYVGMQIGITIMENNMKGPQKT